MRKRWVLKVSFLFCYVDYYIICHSDYVTFAEILTQSPLRRLKFQLKTKLSAEDLKHMTLIAKTRFEIIIQVLKSMPSSLLLVIR